MDQTVVLLSRLQFASTIFFHFIFVPLTLGLSIIIAWMETRYVLSGDDFWKRQTKFWGRLFLINFTLGVVTGITQEFQFGTNWARYSEYVGDIFGSLLAIEATVAFFLESTFIAVWFFGWNKIGRKLHCLCIWIVAIAGNTSAFWIIMANGFMQHPVGYQINEAQGRAVLSSFTDVVFNGFAWGQFAHTVLAAWALSGFFVLGISAWHLLRKSETDFFHRAFKMVAPYTLILSILVAFSGDQEGVAVAKYQPAKLAAMEAHWRTQDHAPFYLIVWPDPENRRNSVEMIGIPSLLSLLAYHAPSAEVKGLLDFPVNNWPPVTEVFWCFRAMALIGVYLLALSIWATWQRKRPEPSSALLKILVWNIPIPYICIMFGWTVAEMGRQPWIVYDLLRTSDAVSPLPSSNVAISLIAFTLLYTVLGILDIYLLRRSALKGPDPVKTQDPKEA
ncbi:MAG: cytochrome ubiquinol oxidase subunit I [Desulfovibrio sp.]|nr:cytochrome ubiquinol oxidase subunit I [Desulfovibrio sp.]